MMRDVIDDQRTTPSELRKKLQLVGFANAETLVPQRGNPVTFQVPFMKKFGSSRMSADIFSPILKSLIRYHIHCQRDLR